jgi:hypothetical protein
MAAMVILGVNIFIGTPDNGLSAAIEIIAIICIAAASIHILVMRILPTGTWRSRRIVFWGGVTHRGYGGYYPYPDPGDLDVSSSGAVPPEFELPEPGRRE